MHYPLHPMQCRGQPHPDNLVIIMLDGWRFDMLNAVNSPHIYRFSQHAHVFKQHFSGGNCTGPGVFSLFYSMPYTYWTSIKQQHVSPVLIEELLNQHYQIGIFRSASLHYPAFDETIFQKIKNLRINTPGGYAYQRDQYITQDFKQFLSRVDRKKPFFSFIFYDTSHNYCQQPNAYAHPFQPAWHTCNRVTLNKNTDREPLFNVYKNAVYFADQIVQDALTALANTHLLDNTIVIITADHGEQFNDNKKSTWGHASDYTTWQLHTPMIIHWPGHHKKEVNTYTRHYDVVPFIMQTLLGCTNDVSDYSIGHSLLSPQKDLNLFAASYVDYAFVQNDQITRIYPNGNISIYDNEGNILPQASLNATTASAFFKLMTQYYQ
jgi:membrane-anchored protein YejM (alkaline phosphatase superfamily)